MVITYLLLLLLLLTSVPLGFFVKHYANDELSIKSFRRVISRLSFIVGLLFFVSLLLSLFTNNPIINTITFSSLYFFVLLFVSLRH